ncbi:DUF397 domain-containing protein [Nocardia sp. NPDC127526]|uniref:DUF397 domain-containing protein n=1 Tax=Nocardia sp. NPDC127526 TaxID=3345393 RepID=UPI0036455AED
MNTYLPEANWFKSSYSGGQTDCVEVAWLPEGIVGLRDSKDPSGPALLFSGNDWAAFTAAVSSGVF